MPDLEDIIAIIEKYGTLSFSRSSGPGGQNVNKLNTNVLLRVPVSEFKFLGAPQRELLRKRLSGRINSEDELFIQVHQERSQLRNRKMAVVRMAELVIGSIHEEGPRRKTKPSRSAYERRLKEKKRRSDVKKNRGSLSDFI